MENKMKNILLLSVLAVFLTSCGSSVQEIQVTTVEVSKTPLNLPNPDPLQMQNVEWIVITKDNANEIFERIKSAGGEYALFAVEDTGYEKLQINFTDIRNKLAEQRQLLLAYREYYEPVEQVE
jgi:PBP1b-binding outer membrane lipoprotein LpoB